jgi:hypothetical protein
MTMPKKAKVPIEADVIAAMDGTFSEWFAGPSWNGWRAILKAAFALPMNDEELGFFGEVAGGRAPPTKRVRELWIIGGRRGGKDSIASLIIAHAAAIFDGRRRQIAGIPLPAMRRGERASIFCLARDRDQSRIALSYVKSYFEEIPELAEMVTRETRDGLELRNGADIIVATNDFRGVRGRSVLIAVLDEVAFFKDETSSSPDVELYAAVKPGMLTLADRAMLIGISTPHKKSGLLWTKFHDCFGRDDRDVLVIKATSLQLNPTLPVETIEAEIAANPDLNRAEYLCEWRTDISSFVSHDIVDAAIMKGRQVLSPIGKTYTGFIDVSGGVHDAHALGIAFKDKETGAAVLACAREIESADTEAVVGEFAAILKSYKLSSAYADRYGAQWVADAFRRHGIELVKSPHDRSAIYLNVLPALNAGQIKLLDLPRIRSQLLALERRTIRGSGRDVIDHPTAGSDDLINCVCGALVMAAANTRRSFAAIDAGGRMIVSDGTTVTVTQLGDDGKPVGPPRVLKVGETNLIPTSEDYMLSPTDRARRDILGANWRSRISASDPSYRPEDTAS